MNHWGDGRNRDDRNGIVAGDSLGGVGAVSEDNAIAAVVIGVVRHELAYIEGIIFSGVADSPSNNFLRTAAGLALLLLASKAWTHAARITLEVSATTGYLYKFL